MRTVDRAKDIRVTIKLNIIKDTEFPFYSIKRNFRLDLNIKNKNTRTRGKYVMPLHAKNIKEVLRVNFKNR